MKQSFVILRLVLLAVAAVNVCFAYMFFFSPAEVSAIYNLPPPTGVQEYLTMTVGAFLGVFGLGALLPFARPLKYASIILMLLLMHFSVFLIDVVVLSRGLMTWKALLPEMIYFLIMSTALVRWYPLKMSVSERAEAIVALAKDAEDAEDAEEK